MVVGNKEEQGRAPAMERTAPAISNQGAGTSGFRVEHCTHSEAKEAPESGGEVVRRHGQVGGVAEWNEEDSVDVVGGREEARVGQNHTEAEAAMVDRGELQRDGAILVTK